MITDISDSILAVWTQSRKTKKNANGWVSGNAPCCIHNGETPDHRGRGGFIAAADGSISWHCFNCGFKTGYQPGRHLSYKLRKLLKWIGVNDTEIQRLVIAAIRVKSLVNPSDLVEDAPAVEIQARSWPSDAMSLSELAVFYSMGGDIPKDLVMTMAYALDRKIDLERYPVAWAPSMAKRLLIPLNWQNRRVGYVARAVDHATPKYLVEHDSNLVFNMEQQKRTSKFVIVTEGVFDAMAVDGVAVLGNSCNEHQADAIESLGREVIVVPDFDVKLDSRGRESWSGGKLVDAAMEYGWTVSFPVWFSDIKDVAAVTASYGKLFAMKSILEGRQRTKLKIELMKKKVKATKAV